MLNPLGTVHGGWALTLIDSATGCAAHTLLPQGVGYTTVETKVNFTRPIKHDTGRVRAEGRVVSRGRQIMTAEAACSISEGRLLAHGTSTLMVFGNGKSGENGAKVSGSSAFTSPPPKTTACACWWTDCGRAASPSRRRGSICG